MKRVMGVGAQMVYQPGPGIPCQLQVLLKAKGKAGMVCVGRCARLDVGCESEPLSNTEWGLFETLIMRADACHGAFPSAAPTQGNVVCRTLEVLKVVVKA